MEFTETERNRLRLWRRWDITFDWFGYHPALKRVHLALLIHPHPWSSRALAEYTQLPHTTVRRHLASMDLGGTLDHSDDGVQISDLGFGFARSFHREIHGYVRGGRNLNYEMVQVLKKAPANEHMNFDKMENHIWWPIIETAETTDG